MRPETVRPPMTLLGKLGSIARHADEYLSPDGHQFDADTIRSLLADSEVVEWMEDMDKASMLPLKRKS